MSENEGGYGLLGSFFKQQEEDRRMREAEAQIRYAARRSEKTVYRAEIESAAAKICAMVQNEAEKQSAERKPEEIAALAAALNHAAAALQTAENYAESQPYHGGMGIGCC